MLAQSWKDPTVCNCFEISIIMTGTKYMDECASIEGNSNMRHIYYLKIHGDKSTYVSWYIMSMFNNINDYNPC